jgi:epoxide hydrolase
MTEPRPFTVEFDEAAIADLRERLARARWPERETVDDWSQGVPLSYLQEVCEYWRDGYDFAAGQARLNAFPQFKSQVDGLGLHFLHVQSPHRDALPIVITHGWPGTFVEFLDVIEPLTNPDNPRDAFHVVVPSLPGFGFSDRPRATGWNLTRTASAWNSLMGSLGYQRYGAQGGDWGALLTTVIARDFAEHLLGVHVNMPVVPLGAIDMPDLTAEEQDGLARIDLHRKTGRGYSEEQSTRPQTIGAGLTDSPVLQCAWILEKCYFWTDCNGHPEQVFTKEQMLDNISVYWFTATAASSARYYWENFYDANDDGPTTEPVTVPSGVSVFPKEIMTISRRMAEARFADLRWFNRLDRGGHFAAWEQPELFVRELRSFFRTVR